VIQLYTWKTPNGRKVSIMLEEIGLPYTVRPVDFGKREQFAPEFLAISPNNKIPAIVDEEGPGGKPMALFESGAILLYLAEKSGRLLPRDLRSRHVAVQWLMFQMGGVGPMFGQAHYFLRADNPAAAFAVERFLEEVRRLYRVMEGRLAQAPYFAGEYSIADVAVYPWVSRHEMHKVQLEEFPNVKRWYDALSARAAVQKGMAIP
jgi:GST-like protein